MTPHINPGLVLLIIAALLFSNGCRKRQELVEDYSHPDPKTLSKGDTIMPFRFINPKQGDWKVEVRISGEDLHDVSHEITSRKFTTKDPKVLNRIRKLRFVYGVGRIHKPTSTFRVYDDITLYEQHGIVFEKKYLALQSKAYGIMTCADQEEFFHILTEMY
jgi:hypothetical protein